MRPPLLFFARAASFAAILAAVATAADPQAWPQWRGPSHDGIAPACALVDAFPAAGPSVLWVRELGQGYSGFAVAGGKAYTQTQTLYEQSLVCLDGETGQTLWSYAYGWPYDGGGLYPGPRSTPTIAKGHVYFAAPNGLVGCLTAADGKLVWSLNVNEKFGGRGTGFGYSASPLVLEGRVFLPVGGEGASVVAIDAEDGSLVWKSGSQPASYATLLPIVWNGEPLLIAFLQNSLACFHRETGELWWELPLSHGYDEHSASPIYREPHLWISGPFRGGARLYRLEASMEDSSRCRPVREWDTEKLSNDVASSVLFGETVYGFDLREPQARLRRPSRGEFRALDFLSGEVRWSSNEPGHAQIIVADGKLVLFNDRGEVILARASPAGYEELGRTAIFPGEVSWTPPALADGRLYLRTQTRAACLYLGKTPLAASAPRVTVGAIAVRKPFDPAVLVGSEREFPATTPDWREFWSWWAWSAGAVAIVFGLWSAATCCRWGILGLAANSPDEPNLVTDNPFRNPHLSSTELACCTLLFLIGIVGSPLLHRWRPDDYVFTWPLSLWAAFQLTIACSWQGRQAPFWSRPRALSYLAGLVLFAVCGLYFHLCRWLGLAIEWGFLTGLLWSFPLAIGATWLAHRESGWARWLAPLGYVVSFSGYYWSTVAFLYAWLRLGD